MAHIKCRYYDYRCGYGDYYYQGTLCKDPEYGDDCKAHMDHWYDEARHMYALSERCVHAYKSYTEFEGDYKKYECDDFELYIPRRHINMDKIEYLEIDGRVIVGDEPQTDCAWK